jgi:thiosulfate/3-mercaptopyruvate sulfurtransferase
LPFVEVINENKTFKNKEDLNKLFKEISKNFEENLVFSCGSGVTACVLALAYSLVDTKYLPTIYDGSWSEYGKI